MGWGGGLLQGIQARGARADADARREMAERDFQMRAAAARRSGDSAERAQRWQEWQAQRQEALDYFKNRPSYLAQKKLLEEDPGAYTPELDEAYNQQYLDALGPARTMPNDPRGPEWMDQQGNLRPNPPGAQVPAQTRPVGPGPGQLPIAPPAAPLSRSSQPQMPGPRVGLPPGALGGEDAPLAADRRGTLDQAASRRLGLAGAAPAPMEMRPGEPVPDKDIPPGYVPFGPSAALPENAGRESGEHNTARFYERAGNRFDERQKNALTAALARRRGAGGKDGTKDLEIQQKGLLDARDAIDRLRAGQVQVNGVWTYVTNQQDPTVRAEVQRQLAEASARVDAMQRALYFGWRDATPGRNPYHLLDARGYAAVRLSEMPGGDTPANRAKVAEEIKLRYGQGQ